MINRKMMTEMLVLQDEINAQVDPEWRVNRNPFLRAAMMEAHEVIEHYGWKWWKKQEPASNHTLQMELVDIWHFYLSELIILSSEEGMESLADRIIAVIEGADIPQRVSDIPFISKMELFIVECAMRNINLPLFSSLMEDVDLTWDKLYRYYIGKNALNSLRQNKGYKEGTYSKIWRDGREDNEHLTEILDNTDVSKLADPYTDIYNQLELTYETTGAVN